MSSVSPRRGADVLVEALIANGVETLFGVPGDTGVVFYDALFHQRERIEHVLARDERHAAYMADAFARVTNRVGVVEVSSGGGTTYVVGGLGDAYASGIPVLLLTSDIHRSSRGTGALTEIDQVALFSAVTKWQVVVEKAADMPGAVAEALRTAVSGRPGPVALIVPEDVLEEMTDAPVVTSVSTLPAERKAADASDVLKAVALLEKAEKPAIVVGGGVHASAAYSELAQLAGALGAGVATSIHGQGAISTKDDWWLGIVGNNGGQPGTNRYLAEADVVLLVGTRGNATNTNSWTAPARSGTTVIQIDIEEARAGRNFDGSTGLAGDARMVLAQLLSELTDVPHSVLEKRRQDVAAARADATQPTDSPEHAPGVIYPRTVIESVHAALGDEVTVIGDPGTPTPNVAVFWPVAEAGRRTVIPRGHGPMGYAIPAAIGVAKALPGKPVVSVTADGSFAMACGELETATRFGLPVLFIQLTNNSMGWIKMLQHLYTGGRYFGVDPGPVDAVMVARANGVDGVKVTSAQELKDALASFAQNPRPFYIDVDVPHMIDYAPPVPAWDKGLAGNTERPVY